MPLAKLHSYIMVHYHNVDGDTESRGVVEILKAAYEDKTSISFLSDVEKADLNITDFRPVLEDRSLSQDFREHIQQESIPASVKNELLRPMVESVVFEIIPKWYF